MKEITYLLILIFAFSCTKKEKDYVTLQGKVKDSTITTINVQSKDFKKEIPIKNLAFKDTLKINKEGIYVLSTNKGRTSIYLKNGYDLTITFGEEKMFEGLTFKGNGTEANEFISKKIALFMSDLGNPKYYFKLEKEEFNKTLSETKSKLESLRKEVESKLDTSFIQMDKRNDEMFFNYITSNYEKMHSTYTKTAKGTPSPTFEDYENYKGGKTSLKDLKGKYVYIDVWATWCTPCLQQIPFLKQLEKEYHGKNIEFVSISIDKPNAYQTWRNMVKKEQLIGVQLFAKENSSFITEYAINSIPRFILLDPEGKIVDADTYRPSDPKLKELFNNLGI